MLTSLIDYRTFFDANIDLFQNHLTNYGSHDKKLTFQPRFKLDFALYKGKPLNKEEQIRLLSLVLTFFFPNSPKWRKNNVFNFQLTFTNLENMPDLKWSYLCLICIKNRT